MHRGERMAAQPPKGAERDRAMCSARGPSSARAGKRASRERSEFGEKPKSQRRRSAQPPALPSSAAPSFVYFFGDMVKFEAFLLPNGSFGIWESLKLCENVRFA